jgi:hypothetical protein
VCAQRLVHDGEGAGGQRVLARQRGQQHLVARPQRCRSPAGIAMEHRAGTVTMPCGSRRTTMTPASAVRVTRSPGCQPSTWVMAWLVSRPEASIRLIL